MYTNFNAVDRIDRSLSEVSTPKRHIAQMALFDMLWVQILRAAWAVREEITYAQQRTVAIRGKANQIPGSETFSSFCRAVGNEMLRELLSEDTRPTES